MPRNIAGPESPKQAEVVQGLATFREAPTFAHPLRMMRRDRRSVEDAFLAVLAGLRATDDSGLKGHGELAQRS
jgi:hypothetical protein